MENHVENINVAYWGLKGYIDVDLSFDSVYELLGVRSLSKTLYSSLISRVLVELDR